MNFAAVNLSASPGEWPCHSMSAAQLSPNPMQLNHHGMSLLSLLSFADKDLRAPTRWLDADDWLAMVSPIHALRPKPSTSMRACSFHSCKERDTVQVDDCAGQTHFLRNPHHLSSPEPEPP